MTDSFLVYDGRTRLFRRGARALARRSPGLRLVPWEAEGTRRFFEAQFGEHLFAFVLIEPDVGLVHAGGETVRRLLTDRGASPWLASAAERGYGVLADPFGRAVHGQAPADLEGSFPIAEAARPHIEALRRDCSLASCDDPGHGG
jgi:hypothetical protein